MAKNISDLPHALAHSDELTRLLDVRSPAVFLDYDGTLTPIVDRPEDAVISHGMRRTVRELAGRCRVCVVSGRDRRVVQELMGLDNLIVAGSHGFDIWSPEGTVEREEGAEFEALLDRVKRPAPRGARSHRGCPGRAQENLDCGALPAGLRRGAS